MLLIAASDANVFGDPVPSVLNAALPEEGKKMIGLRVAARENIFTETGRREGRALSAYKEGMMRRASCIQVGSFALSDAIPRRRRIAGYVLERMPKMCATSFVYPERASWHPSRWSGLKHGIIYEFATKEGF